MSKNFVVSIMFPILGLCLYFFAGDAQIVEVGRVTYGVGLLAFLIAWVRNP